MQHSAFTIVTEIKADGGHVAALETLLDDIGGHIDDNPHLRFADLTDLHYASFSIVALDGEAPQLIFEGNVDGRPDAFLRQLARVARGAVDEIYSHCAGYPEAGTGTPAAVVEYLLAHDIGTNTFYVAWPGWSVEELRREQQLRDRIEELVDGLGPGPPGGWTPEALHSLIGERLRADPDLAWAATPPPLPFLVRHGSKAVALLVAPVVLALLAVVKAAAGDAPTDRRRVARATLLSITGGAVGAVLRLRAAEVADDRRDAARDPDWQTAYARWSEHLGDIRHLEDVQVQNHMTSVVGVKEGWFRLTLLRIVLLAINLTARLTANKGSLGGISSIHFARWVITPDGKRLIFLTNYDGSWESYLNEFIDKAAIGLTAVWTNTDNEVGFPRTRWLVTEGARDEVRFKAYARSSMVPTNTWYSAYPTLTVSNIRNNMQIRKDLFAPLDGAGTRAWLRRL